MKFWMVLTYKTKQLFVKLMTDLWMTIERETNKNKRLA